MNELGSGWAYDNIVAGAFRNQAFKAPPQYYHLLQRHFIHTPENTVLMHQCAISAKDINPKAASPDLSDRRGEQAAWVHCLSFIIYHFSFSGFTAHRGWVHCCKSSMFKIQRSKCRLISFARLCNGASALNFPRERREVSSEGGC